MELLCLDVDTQRDFLDPAGTLYVPGSQEILPNIRRLLEWATAQRVTTISAMDAHLVDDAEFRQYPPHCVEGSAGQRRYFEALPALPRHVWEPEAQPRDLRLHLEPGHHYLAKKRAFPVIANAAMAALVSQGAFRGRRCIVFGVATDVCVRADVLDLCAAGAEVRVVSDAVAGLTPESTARALEEMRLAGATFWSTDAIVEET